MQIFRRQFRGTLWIFGAMAMVMVGFTASPVFAATPLITANQPIQAIVLTARASKNPAESPMVYLVKLQSGSDKGKTVSIGAAGQPVSSVGVQAYKKGDKVVLDSYQDDVGTTQYVITDYQRQSSLFWLLLLFVLIVIWVSRWRGVRSLVGLAFSFVVMLYWMVPRIAAGHPPVIESIIGCSAILVFSLVVTEGFGRRTWAALVGMVATMAVIGLLSTMSIHFAHLTGQASEEALYLKNNASTNINLQGLLLAGFIIGTLGILTDIGIGQVATVAELNIEPGDHRTLSVYARAMRVGLSHMSAIIHTLVLAYAGAALPLLVLFSAGGLSFTNTVSNEIVATEVVRTIVGSIGLVLALPLTTLVAVWFNVKPSGHSEAHHHH